MHHPCYVVSPADRIVQEQCCVTVLEDNLCTSGINMAKDQGACDSLFSNTCESKTTKVCFHLCVHICVFLYVYLTNSKFCKYRQKRERIKSLFASQMSLSLINVLHIILLDSHFGGE